MGNERPNIAEKVKFWEEQDKINQAFIPRVIEMNETLQKLSKQSLKHGTQTVSLTARLDAFDIIVKEFRGQIKVLSENQNKEEEKVADEKNNLSIYTLALAILALIISLVSLFV